MPEIRIIYEKPEALKAIKDLAKRFDFKISNENGKKNEPYYIRGVKVLPPTEEFDPSDMSDIFTENNIDAAKLRKEAWQRKS